LNDAISDRCKGFGFVPELLGNRFDAGDIAYFGRFWSALSAVAKKTAGLR